VARGKKFQKLHGFCQFLTADVRLLTWADQTPLPDNHPGDWKYLSNNADHIGSTRQKSRWTGNGWRLSTRSGSAWRAAIYRTRPTVAKPGRQLEPRPAIAAHEPRRRMAPRLESRAGIDPFQRVRVRLASRRGRREGASRPGRNDIFGLSNFQPRRHGHYVVVGAGSRCDGGVFSKGGDCLRSAWSVPTYRTSGRQSAIARCPGQCLSFCLASCYNNDGNKNNMGYLTIIITTTIAIWFILVIISRYIQVTGSKLCK